MIPPAAEAADPDAIAALIFDRGVSFPWRTDDPRLTASGVIGEAHAASPELGQAIIDSIVEQTRGGARAVAGEPASIVGAGVASVGWAIRRRLRPAATGMGALLRGLCHPTSLLGRNVSTAATAPASVASTHQ